MLPPGVIDFLLERLYHELAWAYDMVSWAISLGHWQAWTRVVSPHLMGRRIVEIGCGTGHLLTYLAGRGQRVWGCDPSSAMLRQAQRSLRRAGVSASLCQARAQQLPFPPAALDTIVCTFPTDYIRDSESWAEFSRVLTPAGRVVVLYGAVLAPQTPLHRLARLLLSLGRVSEARGGRKPLAMSLLTRRWDFVMRHEIVPVGKDCVGLLIAERFDGPDLE